MPSAAGGFSSSRLAEAPGRLGPSHESRLSAVTFDLRVLTKSLTASALDEASQRFTSGAAVSSSGGVSLRMRTY
ncbi:Uncharacterised protein [Mycobacteroides abscessus subsp. abscessus]|nr:Uncharacterised protein [Mycobacteroides abscessus subsp. abscessus]